VHTGPRWVNLKERDHLENLGEKWRIILKCIFKKYDDLEWMIWLLIGTSAGFFE
jgi:hypothetical protein